MQFILLLIPVFLTEYVASAFKHVQQDKVCGRSWLSNLEGVITSPNYPSVYPNHTSCTWVIISPPESKLTISVMDFDIEEDSNCNHPPCCMRTWLSLPKDGGKGTQQFCGSKTQVLPVTVVQNLTFIKFHSSKVVTGGRGFQLRYATSVPESVLEPLQCTPGAKDCSNGLKCITVNGAFLCKTDHTIADHCTGHNVVPCGSLDSECYDNVTQRCDGLKDCASGVDEINCGSHNCYSDELMCHSGDGCYKIHKKCDMKMDCSDFSDEINCGFCADGLVLCSSTDRRCFSPSLERCDGKFDCLFGEDEVGCVKGCPEDEIACINGEGCYSPLQRCDSIRNCRDDSDETNCPSCSTITNKFPCDNGRCISEQFWCNGMDDCGDGSDEQSCLKTSIITVAIMGSLICGLLLIIAMGCVCRLYGIRLATGENYRLHGDHLVHTARHALLQPNEAFFHREPPPAYTVTANDCQPLQRLPTSGSSTRLFPPDHNSRYQNRTRTARRHLNGRRRSQRTLARISPPSDAGSTETVLFRPRSSSLANLHNTTHRMAVVPTLNSPSSIHETSLEVQQDSLIVTSDCKSVGVSELAVDTSGICTSMAELDLRDGCASPVSSSTTSSSESPSRESGTSSTSLMSYQSGNDDTELLVL